MCNVNGYTSRSPSPLTRLRRYFPETSWPGGKKFFCLQRWSDCVLLILRPDNFFFPIKNLSHFLLIFPNRFRVADRNCKDMGKPEPLFFPISPPLSLSLSFLLLVARSAWREERVTDQNGGGGRGRGGKRKRRDAPHERTKEERGKGGNRRGGRRTPIIILFLGVERKATKGSFRDDFSRSGDRFCQVPHCS